MKISSRRKKKPSSPYANRHWPVAFLAALFFLLVAGVSDAQTPPTAVNVLRIGMLTSVGANPHSASVERGVHLGAAEAGQTARLFGNDVELYAEPGGSDVLASATRLSSRRKVQVLIGSSPTDIDALSRFAEQHHILFLNVASRADSLRAACRRYTFHVEASEGMYANAAAPGRPPADLSAPASSRVAKDSVVLWGSTLERYGAAQINDRYRAKYGVGMDGAAWAGWVAIKIASEAALRARSGEPARMLAYLENPAATFDGHKGWPLSFRSTDHQLRQPLYVVSSPASTPRTLMLREVPELRAISPDAGGNGSARLNQALDRLITSALPCPWSKA